MIGNSSSPIGQAPASQMPKVGAGVPALRTKLFYGVGSIAFGVKDQGFGILLFFYNQVVGLSPTKVGAAIAVALIVDAIVDPIVGQTSDNLRTRWGRRHPFMYAAAIPVAVAYWLLWNPPQLAAAALIHYLIAAAPAVRIYIPQYDIPSVAWEADR